MSAARRAEGPSRPSRRFRPSRLRSFTALLVVATAALTTAAGAPPAAAAAPGTITVTVVASDTGAPLDGFCAELARLDGTGGSAGACAEPGSPRIVFPVFVDGIDFDVSVTLSSFTGYLQPVDNHVTATTPADVTFVAPRAAIIRGTLEYTDGTRPGFGTVVADPVPGPAVPFAPSGFIRLGTYQVFVAPGRYTLQFRDSATGATQWALGATTAADATVLTAVEGQTLVVDDTLLVGSDGVPAPGTVAGRVTDPVTGDPVPGLCPLLLPPDAGTGVPPESCAAAGVDPTGADGRYAVSGDPGDHLLLFLDPAGVRAARGVAVTLAPHVTVARDLTVGVGGALTGRVVDSSTGQPLPGRCVAVRVGRTTEVTGYEACSDADGRWTATGVEPGTATVLVPADDTHVDVWAPAAANQATATAFAVRSGATTDTGTVTQPRGAVLSGRVVDRRGTPVAGAWVVVGTHSSRHGNGAGRWTAQTGTDGRYTVTNLPRQDSVVTVYAPDQPYAWQWSGGATDPARARRIAFRDGGTPRLDATLAREATLAVRLKDPDGVTVGLDALTVSGADVGWSVDAAASGTQVVRGLPTSRVRLRVTVGSTVLWYAGDGRLTADPARAVLVAVTTGRPRTVVVDVAPYSGTREHAAA